MDSNGQDVNFHLPSFQWGSPEEYWWIYATDSTEIHNFTQAKEQTRPYEYENASSWHFSFGGVTVISCFCLNKANIVYGCPEINVID